MTDPDHVELTTDELREVARFAAQAARSVVVVHEDAEPGDGRPRAAIEAADDFAAGAPRSHRQRVTALDAHRAAKAASTLPAKHAAHAAGDAAAAAYLHPLARANQLGHILRADAHAAYVEELLSGDPAVGVERIRRAAERASPLVVDVLRRYPPAADGGGRVAVLMKSLDDLLRAR